MRMASAGASAADVVAQASVQDLASIIATLGEERMARAVARAIVRERTQAPIRTTRALAEIVGRVVHARPGAIHPATRTFQALRMFVNEELSELAEALKAAEAILKPAAGWSRSPFTRSRIAWSRRSSTSAASAVVARAISRS